MCFHREQKVTHYTLNESGCSVARVALVISSLLQYPTRDTVGCIWCVVLCHEIYSGGRAMPQWVYDSVSHCISPQCITSPFYALQQDAPSGDDLKESAGLIEHWCPTALLDKWELELVCTLHWWSQADLVERPWSKTHDGALERLETGIGRNPKASREARRVACFKLLEAVCETINTLMSTQAEDTSQAGNPTTSGTVSSSTSTPASPDVDTDVTATQPPQPSPAPVSDRDIAPEVGQRTDAPLPPQQPSRTDERVEDNDNVTSSGMAVAGGTDEEVGSEIEAKVGDGAGGAEVPVNADDDFSRPGGPSQGAVEGSPGSVVPGERATPQLPTDSPQTFSRAISKGENDTFKDLFMVIRATPRKIKRVVNV